MSGQTDDITFDKYERFSETIEVEAGVLFGDLHDVKLKKVRKAPTKSQGGTIKFELRPFTEAYKGTYIHAKVTHKDTEWFHLVHHCDLDGAAIGRFLCDVNEDSVARPWTTPYLWNRYDWCHYRNWGSASPDEDSESEDESKKLENLDLENDDDYVDEDDEEDEEDEETDRNIYFVSIDSLKAKKPKQLGRLKLTPNCISGDWNYGLRLVDPKSSLAYAYAYGDSVINYYLAGGEEKPNREKTDFREPWDRFVKAKK